MCGGGGLHEGAIRGPKTVSDSELPGGCEVLKTGALWKSS